MNWEVGGGRWVGGRQVGENFGVEKRRKKIIPACREDVFLVHPQNSFNRLILNWCIGGCWFIPALLMPLGTLNLNHINYISQVTNGESQVHKFKLAIGQITQIVCLSKVAKPEVVQIQKLLRQSQTQLHFSCLKLLSS